MTETTIDPRAFMAARNNVDWYAMMFDVHGLLYEQSTAAFRAIDPPPPYHSWIVLLDPTPATELLELIAAESGREGFGLKDSYRCLDFASYGLNELFAASWIYADRGLGADTAPWRRIDSADDLLTWEAAWKDGGSPSADILEPGRQFPDAILDRTDVAIWGRASGNGFDAGAVSNLSSDCVGMSNVFGRNAVAAAATLCTEFGSGLPVVGYERGDPLGQSMSAGFEEVGGLRVCVRPG